MNLPKYPKDGYATTVNSRTAIITLLLPATLFAGCASQDQINGQQAVVDYLVGDYPNAKKLLQPISVKPDEDYVLNNVRLGSTDLAMNDVPGSQSAFFNAYEVLNSYGVNTGGRTLGAVLVDEKIKIWRGEPFERAMANFYLGLTYYIQADYNNARAAFENSLFKLRDYGADKDAGNNPDQFRAVDSNFILAQYMLARCYQRLGNDVLAASNFKRVIDLAPPLAPFADVSMNAKSNVLLVIDFGSGPTKSTTADGAISGFTPRPEQVGPPPRPDISVDGTPLQSYDLNSPLEDLIVLAQDQRWQSIDTIRTIKTVLGTGLIAGGAVTALTAQRGQTAAIGLGLIAAGALLKATSQADTRMWEMLPRSTYAVPVTLSPGKHDISVAFSNGARETMQGVDVKNDGETTLYFRILTTTVYTPWR